MRLIFLTALGLALGFLVGVLVKPASGAGPRQPRAALFSVVVDGTRCIVAEWPTGVGGTSGSVTCDFWAVQHP